MGYPVVEIPYYKNKRFNFVGYLEALKSARPGSVVILHACAQNPTGCDPTMEQWKEIGATIKSRNLFSIFNAAYLGFNSGDVDKDAWAIRYFASEIHLKIGLARSFAKNIGLSGERIGLVAFVTNTVETRRNVDSVLERVQRFSISTPQLMARKWYRRFLGLQN
ncbi:pyridoxal phosphate-dependent transferase [Leptodontidium sp. 2 PMI_412]|nr:pyridoxal phosphate-dependent transferase [Leptodontidium sp. 2 PMI_412]